MNNHSTLKTVKKKAFFLSPIPYPLTPFCAESCQFASGAVFIRFAGAIFQNSDSAQGKIVFNGVGRIYFPQAGGDFQSGFQVDRFFVVQS